MVCIVCARPNPDEFNHAILERVKAGLEESGQEFAVSDLYAEGFGPLFDQEDLALNAEGRVKPELRPYQEKIKARWLVFFPVWWFGPPAILKGFFDRIFSRGFADEPGSSGFKPLLTGKKALAISSAGFCNVVEGGDDQRNSCLDQARESARDFFKQG